MHSRNVMLHPLRLTKSAARLDAMSRKNVVFKGSRVKVGISSPPSHGATEWLRYVTQFVSACNFDGLPRLRLTVANAPDP